MTLEDIVARNNEIRASFADIDLTTPE